MLSFDENRDFPFYNGIPKMSRIGWFVLLISMPVAYKAFYYFTSVSNEFVGSIFFLAIMLIPLLFFPIGTIHCFSKSPQKMN